jgi:hypothetical protein
VKRLLLLVLLAAAMVLGLLSRWYPIGWRPWDESLGDALYAIAAYLLIQFLRPMRPFHAWILATAFCSLIEAFKFTNLPAHWSHYSLSRLAFGTTPSLANLLSYFAGTTFAAWLQSLLTKRTTSKGVVREATIFR